MNWGIKALQASALPLGYGAGKKNGHNVEYKVPDGADYETRTRYLHLGKVALYQMS